MKKYTILTPEDAIMGKIQKQLELMDEELEN